jgi:hypothetical protein
LLAPEARDYDAASLQQLQAKLNNMHILVHDVDGPKQHEHVAALERNVHFFPYKLNVAYTPKRSTRAAAIVAPVPRCGPDPLSWDFPTVDVRGCAATRICAACCARSASMHRQQAGTCNCLHAGAFLMTVLSGTGCAR